MRLDKFICNSSALSRTQAKSVIGKGGVTLDGVIVKDPATKVSGLSVIVCSGRLLRSRGPRYLMLNKPLGTACTAIDDDHRSLMRLIDLEKRETLHFAGRLDADTTGLVLLTDDGKWSHRITSPRKQCAKRYRVWLAEPVAENAIELLSEGILLKGEKHPTRPAKLEMITPNEGLLTLHEGKYHQVKRMFGALNNRVVGLHREQIGKICLDPDLAPGEWRFLTTAEVSSAG